MTKKPRRKPPRERPYVSNLELRGALAEKLDERELNALEKEIRTAVEIACERAVQDTIRAVFIRHWAITIRVLADRFGFEQQQLMDLYQQWSDYLIDIAEDRITVDEMLSIMERDDSIRFVWETVQENAGKQ